jgi:Fe-S oxidoreductase
LARDLDLRYAVMIPAGVEAVLLVEAEAASADRLAANLREIEHLAVDRWGLAAGAVAATHPDDCALIWQLADQAAQRLHRVQGSTTAVPLPREIALPRGAIPEFLNRTLAILKKHQVTASIYVQAGCGLFHLRPFLNLAADGDRQKLRALAGETYASARELGGVVGDGAGRLADDDDAAAAGDEDLAAAAGELKRLFDPLGVFQPGGHPPESPEVAAGGLRSASAAEPERTFALQLDWTPADMGQAADACNGCAACRTQEDASRMCPIFRHAPQEESSPRAKANLVRALLSGRLPADFRRSEACKQLADLCVHCHMCRVECPSNVDVPRLMVELKADFVATNGLDLHDRCLAYVDRLCKLAARVPRLANWAMGNRGARWILEKTLGVAQGRKLPLLSRQPFLHSGFQKQRSRLQADAGDKVLFFVDTFANHFDTQLARAAVEVLEHCGVTVYIPGAQLESAMPMIAQGVVEPARRIAERNVSLLAEAVRQGCAVVTVEPSAALALQREYLHLLPEDNDARIVADAACDWSHYLWSRHQRGLLPLNFQPVDLSVAYHVPCHVKALEIGAPALHLLNLVPGLRIRLLEKGCSGIAGLFGFKRSHYRTSLRMGLPLMTEMRTGRFAAGVTDCSTCRIQMEQGAAKPTLHPAKILALAYGLMPEIADHLKRTNASLVVR